MLIHEISRKLGITARAIRFYEQKGLLSPSKLKENGYRTYTEQDAWRLQTIISLREVGMPLQDIRRTLETAVPSGQEEVLQALQLQRSLLFQQWTEMQQVIATMDQMIEAAKHNQQLPTEQLYELARQSKAVRDLRKSWRDHWDFDAKAVKFDQLLADGTAAHPGPGRRGGGREAGAAYETALQTIAAFIGPAPGDKGLDIGTGTGNLAAKLQRLGAQMSAIDQSKQMLKVCGLKHPEIEVKLGNALAIPYMDGLFDFAVSSFAMHHFTEQQRPLAWEEMLRVVRPGGKICICDYMLKEPSEQQQFLRKLIDSGAGKLPMMHSQVELYPVLSSAASWFRERGCRVASEPAGEGVYVLYVQK